MVRVAFATLGCKVNRADTSSVRVALPAGVEVVPFDRVADIYVINTCTVTATADRQSRQLVRRAHRRNPSAQVVVTGCLADRWPEQVEGLGGVVLVAPNQGKATLATEIARLAGVVAEPLSQAAGPPMPVYAPEEVTRPPLKIQDGCDGGCTYCAVAAARGRPTSLPLPRVLEQLRALGRQGCPEVVLAGIDLGSWGRDLNPPSDLATLLEAVLAERPVARVRLSSIEVLRLEDRVLEQLGRAAGRICHHLHLPLQSGADPVLARMGRPYDAQTYADRVRAALRAVPGIAIGADVIAGFPGETEQDHRQTVALIEGLGIAYLHVFPFSPRPGTVAATLPDPVPDPVLRARAEELRTLGERLWRDFRTALVGQRTTAVISTQRAAGTLTGFSNQAVPLELEGPALWTGRLAEVELGALTSDGMTAGLVAAVDLQ